MNKKAVLNKLKKKVSFFLSLISWKKILTFSIFVLIATILWFMQIYNKEFETTVALPIKYEAIPNDIIIQNTLPNRVYIKLKDNGLAMFAHHYLRHDTVFINIGSLVKNTNSTNITIQGATLDQYIRNSISQQSQIINYTPILIPLSYAPLSKKRLPVIFDGTIDLPPGYLLSQDIKITPDSITAYGSEKDLNKLLYAYTDMDTIKRIKSVREIPIKLRSIPNVKTNTNTVKILVKVEAFTQQTLDIQVECINLPKDVSVRFFPSKVKIMFYCGVSQLDSINKNDFMVSVDYLSLKESSASSVPVRITSKPDYAHNITIVPSNVEFIFEHR